MPERVDLIWLSRDGIAPKWGLGQVWVAEPTPSSVCRIVEEKLPNSDAVAWLFWDATLGEPEPERVREALKRPGDLWHAGLRLGMSGLPGLLDYIVPSWMLIVDPEPDREASSWRLSLRACLVKREVLHFLGGPVPAFRTLEGASLEMGYRYLKAGAVTRHVPWIIPREPHLQKFELPLEDELLFVFLCFKPWWLYWSLFRAGMSGQVQLTDIIYLARRIMRREKRRGRASQRLSWKPNIDKKLQQPNISVTVVLPTLRRYEYLARCLDTLRNQTIRPCEIICVDQTPRGERRVEFYDDFKDLPLRVIYQDRLGQSLARNTALSHATGEWIFFADDDSEYPSDVIEKHLMLIQQTGADGSTGLSLPPYEYVVPDEYRQPRIAYNLDTGNALIRRQAVISVGGFDRQFDFGKGADTDLGMRLYLSGYLIMHNPAAWRIHHKPAHGGLRTFGAWWETRDLRALWKPRPAPTYAYFLMRYFGERLSREALWHSLLFGNIPRLPTRRAKWWELLVHYSLELLMLPITVYRVRKSLRMAKRMLIDGPRLMDEPFNG